MHDADEKLAQALAVLVTLTLTLTPFLQPNSDIHPKR